MSKSLKVLGVTVFYWALGATAVLARGGGGRGGSFSAPRSSGGLSGGGLSGGGLGGGLGGGFFGTGTRGFFPFFFFGGGSFFTLLILAAIAFFVFRMLMNRFSNRSSEHGRNFAGGRQVDFGQPVDLEGRAIKNDRSRFGSAITYTRQNMDYYAQKFPRWDYSMLNGRVRQVFFFLQEAWSRQDMSEGQDYLAPALLADYRAKLDAMKARGERNIVRDPDLSEQNIDFVHCQLDTTGERFAARIFASLYDYTVDLSGKVISGEEDNRLYFNEFWEFVWQDNKWKLAAIYQEDSEEAVRWARVDEL